MAWAAADFNARPGRGDDEGPGPVFLAGRGRTWVRHPLRGFDGAGPSAQLPTRQLVPLPEGRGYGVNRAPLRPGTPEARATNPGA